MEPIKRKKDIQAIKRKLGERPRDLCLFTVGINCGLRGSDLLGLQWSDVLTAEGRIRSVIELRESKTGKVRRIAVSDAIRCVLTKWRGVAGESSPYVFPSRKGGCMTIQRLHQLVNGWAADAGVRGHFGTHTLRKTYGYHLYRQGTDIALLMRIFGHSSQAITLRYIGIEQKQIDEANLKLNL